jgi:hypothetical protein
MFHSPSLGKFHDLFLGFGSCGESTRLFCFLAVVLGAVVSLLSMLLFKLRKADIDVIYK